MLAAPREVLNAQALRGRMHEARRRSDDLFSIVDASSLYDRPIPERHRIVFYIGHLEAFDWNLLHENIFGLRSFHPEFDRLFAFGIDPVEGQLPSDRPSDWPPLHAVRDYVRRIRAALDEKLTAESFESETLVRNGFRLETLLNVAIEHRLMHVETLAYMLHQLPLDRKLQQASLPITSAAPVMHRMADIAGGNATLGLARRAEDFGWDNEFEKHTVEVPSFAIDQYMVTNGQFLDFINSGGYHESALWNADDWDWKTANDVQHPAFWKKVNEKWMYCGMFEETPLPLDWPVYVSHAEASAYARWAGKSLPSEAQWQRAAYGSPSGVERYFPWGDQAPRAGLGNFDFANWDPTPVNSHPQNRSAFGVEGLLGNGWEWTSTVFHPYPGFEPFPFYPGYSANFFDGKHFVMKGGSARTAACMLRPTFRNWFQAHYQYVYAGFRCVNG
jgi:gamma-glutamyl hercynylcysteine S-oxide synthase